jgi:hypothetical protein
MSVVIGFNFGYNFCENIYVIFVTILYYIRNFMVKIKSCICSKKILYQWNFIKSDHNLKNSRIT